MNEILPLLLTGAAGAAVIKLTDNVIMWALNRKAKREENEDEEEDAVHQQLKALRTGQKVILLDRIQYLGQCYIFEGEIDFDDRRRLHQMHDAYHTLGGNGDLNNLMETVDHLPLKGERHE